MPGFGWTVTHVALIYALCVGLTFPMQALLVYIGFSIVRPTNFWFWETWVTTRFSLLTAVVVLLGWMFQGFGRWGRLRPVSIPLIGLVLYLASGGVAAVALSYDRTLALDQFYTVFNVGLMVFVGLSLLHRFEDIRMTAWGLLIIMGFLALEFNEAYFSGWNRVLLRGHGGIDNNGVALIMQMTVPIGIIMGLYYGKWYARGACVLAVGCMTHVVLMAFSRGAQLSLAIGVSLVMFLGLTVLPRKGLTLLASGIFAIAALALAGEEVRERFMTIFADREELDSSAASRFELWAAAWECMLKYPLGVGPRNFNLVNAEFGREFGYSAHNYWLTVGAENGFIGLLGVVLFFGGTFLLCLKTAWQLRRNGVEDWRLFFTVMCAVSLTAFSINSMFVGFTTTELPEYVAMLGLATVAYVRETGFEPMVPDDQAYDEDQVVERE